VRYVTYCGNGFQEGVSVTIYDELRRCQKQCYGLVRSTSTGLSKGRSCVSSSERMAATRASNPALYCVSQIGRQIRLKIYSHRIAGNILHVLCHPWLSLDTAASGWIYLVVNYLFGGWYPDHALKYYNDNLITVASIVILIYPLVHSIYRYIWKRDPFTVALLENYVSTGVLLVFFVVLSTHLSWAIWCHLLSIDVQWDVTPKVIHCSNF